MDISLKDSIVCELMENSVLTKEKWFQAVLSGKLEPGIKNQQARLGNPSQLEILDIERRCFFLM